MEKFKTINGVVAPLNRDNVDTDAIIPKQFLKSIHRSGFGDNLFDEWRYLDHGEPGQDCSNRPLNPDFVLNQARYKNATILLTHSNFGCGSSREHAPWALDNFGFRVIIAESYADIFYNNCFKNGILPICLPVGVIDSFIELTQNNPGYTLSIDLESQTITDPLDTIVHFEIEGYRKNTLLDGLDEIGQTLIYKNDIKQFETNHQFENPWLFKTL